jgi:hypothetical protein
MMFLETTALQPCGSHQSDDLIYFAAMFSFLAIVLACGAVDRLRTDYALLSMMNILVGLVLCSVTRLAYRWLNTMAKTVR